ncbi:cell surface protein [Shewanella sp. WXL01]|uniref:IPT/TIG domain-containing protein n=1 Tax=Shewanella sp. WXL01 TaxID=2709721 RepID=UPI0014385412|nr:IPT/TIG domain-containing protein [Shewanella sp. WXL01]NKF49363.1 cell surface protein [Shewanella sp. WXL01]
MKYKYLWLSMLLASSLTLTGCGGELESGDPAFQGDNPSDPTSPSDPSQPTDPVDPVDPEEPIDPIDYVGTWENKDEDADGVLDEFDDYPFDPTKSVYPVFVESEPNDNPGVATPIEFEHGVKVSGVIDSELDKGDLFKFDVKERRSLTAVFTTPAARFKPQVYVSNEQGLVISDIFLYQFAKPNMYVVNFPLFEAGTYQLSVIDENYAGSSDLTYDIVFFDDADVDSFDDMKERALGADLIADDMDEDSLIDGVEYVLGMVQGSVDIDSDGLPNWQDKDADGDTFTDSVETAADIDFDGFANFIDRDSDGNSIDDQVESGNSQQPNDFDDDGLIDHLDIDDDNDGIFDINDPARLSAAQVMLWQQVGDLFISSLATLFEESSIKYFVRAGDRFELAVEGYSVTTEPVILVLNNQGEQYNLTLEATRQQGDYTYLAFDMPNLVGEGEVSLAIGNQLSEPYPVAVGKAELPLLAPTNANELTNGDYISLSGDNFDADTTVFFNGSPAATDFISNNEISVTVPEGISGGSYSVNNSYGKSNYINFVLKQSVQVNVTVPNAKSISHVGGILPELATAYSGNKLTLDKMGQDAEAIFTYTSENGQVNSYLSALHLPGQSTIEFSYQSTALTNLVLHLDSYYSVRGFTKTQISELVLATSSYAQYVEDATEQLKLNSDFFSYTNRSDQTVALLNHYQSLIVEELSAAPTQSSQARINADNWFERMSAPQQTSNSELSKLEPTIVSYPETVGSWNHFDMSMEATTFAENAGELSHSCGEGVDPKWYQVLNLDGCVEIKNRSQLYLSARVYALDPTTGQIKADLASLNAPVENHISQPWDNAMMAPISGTFLGLDVWSNDSLIDKCVYKDCLYQIVSPGVDGIFGPSPLDLKGSEDYNQKAIKARQYLAIRTIIDNIVIRFYSILLDASGIDLNAPEHRTKQKMINIVKAVYIGLPSIGQEVEKILSKETITQADWTDLAGAIGREIYESEIKKVLNDPTNLGSYGPVTKAILSTLEITPEQFATKMAQKVAEKFIPGWGQISAAYEASMLASSMIDMASTIKDFVVVPTKLDFIVTWGLKASDITPRMIEQNGLTKTFTIVGSGMATVPGVFSDTQAEIKVYDLGNGDQELAAEVVSVNKQGTELIFTLTNVSEIDSAIGPLKVEVHHLEKQAVVPYDILIGTGLTIANITPGKAAAGEEVEITGIGFSRNKAGNKVTFSGANGQRIEAPVKSASTSSLTVIVPAGVITGFVTVEVAETLSNEYPFSGTAQLLITFGDNGNFNDDVFKLSVNNRVVYDNNQPERKVGPLAISLDDGDHSVQLTGIRADDGIATYYIEFSGDVVSVSGDELSGRDLCPNTHKNYQVSVQSGAGSSSNAANNSSLKSSPMVLQYETSAQPTECPVVGN